MAVLTSPDIERPPILGPGRQEQLRLEAPPGPAPAPAARVRRAVPAPAAVPACVPQSPGRPDSTTRPRGELTLDELLVAAWEGVTAHHEVSCPVCRGAMVPRYAAAGPERLGGRCRDCGSSVT